jgi:hypothetical protein
MLSGVYTFSLLCNFCTCGFSDRKTAQQSPFSQRKQRFPSPAYNVATKIKFRNGGAPAEVPFGGPELLHMPWSEAFLDGLVV